MPLPACGIPISPLFYHKGVDTEYGLGVIIGNYNADGTPSGKNFDLNDPKLNCYYGEFQGLPPLYIAVGSQDFKSCKLSAHEIHVKANEFGVDTAFDVVPYQTHTPNPTDLQTPECVMFAFRLRQFLDAKLVVEH